jgi:hypothetical protein
VSAGVIRVTARSVTAEAGASAHQVCRALDAFLSTRSYDGPTVDVNLILHHPMALSEPFKAKGRFDGKRTIYWATITPPYVDWCRAGWAERIALVSAAIRERLERLPKSQFDADLRLALVSTLETGAAYTASHAPTSLVKVTPAFRTPGGGIAFDPRTLAPGAGKPITLAEIEDFVAAPPAPPSAETQFKTYRKGDAGLEYWEAWTSDEGVVEHRGLCGDAGTCRTLPPRRSALETLAASKADAQSHGFKVISDARHQTVTVDLKATDGEAWAGLLARRHALEDWLNEELGWTGLGHCDGGDVGDGSATAFCVVVNVKLAISTLKSRLPESPFPDAMVRRG